MSNTKRNDHGRAHPVLGLLGLIVLGVIIAAAIAGHSNSNSGGGPNTQAPSSSPTTAAPAKLTNVGYDGDFKFVVTGVSCETSDTSGMLTIPAGTQECLVNFKISDDKDQGQEYFASNQYAFDAAGRKFSADDQAWMISGSNDMTNVNPGVTITAVAPFQIPVGDKITRLELHDSMFSGGVEIAP